MFADQSKALSKIFTGQVKARKAISSPIGIAVMFGTHIDWIRFWNLSRPAIDGAGTDEPAADTGTWTAVMLYSCSSK